MDKQIVSFQNETVSLPVYMLDPAMPENLNLYGKWSYNREFLEDLRVIDDAMFTALDVSGGQMTWDEAAVSFGKKAAVSMASAYIGSAGSGAANAAGNAAVGAASTAGTQIAKTATTSLGKDILMGFGKQLANNAISGLADSVTYSHDGGFGFNGGTLVDRMVGQDALVGYLASGAATFTSGMMGKYNLVDGNGNALEAGTFNTRGIQTMNSLVGSAVSSGIQYGLTGSTTLNLLNFSDFTGGAMSGGLLEMRLGGNDGFSMGIGAGGNNFSVGTIASAASGFLSAMKVDSFKNGGEQGQSELAAINGLAWSGTGEGMEFNSELARSLFDRELGITWGDGVDENGEAYNGYFDQGSGSVVVNSAFMGLGNEKAAQFAALLGHEGTHAYGNRVEGIAHAQGIGTYTSLAQMWSGVGDEAFLGSMVDGYNSESSWVENSGERDYWRVTHKADGSIVMEDDGSNDVTIVDGVTGEIQKEYKYGGGKQTQFITDSVNDYFGSQGLSISRDSLVSQMASAGWSHKSVLTENEMAGYSHKSATGWYNTYDGGKAVEIGNLSRTDTQTTTNKNGSIWTSFWNSAQETVKAVDTVLGIKYPIWNDVKEKVSGIGQAISTSRSGD